MAGVPHRVEELTWREIAGLPLVVGYKLNWVTILLASLVVRLYRGFFTMVNIIANREVYQEFLQHHFTPKELVPAVEAILPGGARRAEVEAGMAEVKQLLTPNSSSAGRQAAEACGMPEGTFYAKARKFEEGEK